MLNQYCSHGNGGCFDPATLKQHCQYWGWGLFSHANIYVLLKRGRYMGKRRGREVQPVPTGGSAESEIPSLQKSDCTATHKQVCMFFLKILKQQIMVRTFSTLFQTMMRCYSSLRAGRGHILSFPVPVQQVIPTDRHGS